MKFTIIFLVYLAKVGCMIITHTFSDSLFVNVPVNSSVLTPLLHLKLTVREFHGTAWVSFIASHVTYTKFGILPVPGYTNGIVVRTYVTDKEGNNGIIHFVIDVSNKAYASLADSLYFKGRVSQWTVEPEMSISPCKNGSISFLAAKYEMTAEYPCSESGAFLPPGYSEFFVNSANTWFFQDADKTVLYSSSSNTTVPQKAVSVVPTKLSIVPSTSFPIPFSGTPSACNTPGTCFYLKEWTALLYPQAQIWPAPEVLII